MVERPQKKSSLPPPRRILEVFPMPPSPHYAELAKWERENSDKIALVNSRLKPIYYKLALTRTIDPKYRI